MTVLDDAKQEKSDAEAAKKKNDWESAITHYTSAMHWYVEAGEADDAKDMLKAMEPPGLPNHPKAKPDAKEKKEHDDLETALKNLAEKIKGKPAEKDSKPEKDSLEDLHTRVDAKKKQKGLKKPDDDFSEVLVEYACKLAALAEVELVLTKLAPNGNNRGKRRETATKYFKRAQAEFKDAQAFEDATDTDEKAAEKALEDLCGDKIKELEHL